MSAVYLVSDTHFGHRGVCQFLREDGTKLRPWSDVNSMDHDMIEYWNDTVKPKDLVYHLGDAVMNPGALQIFYRLHGEKVLIAGNHDKAKFTELSRHFKSIRGSHTMAGYILTHIPIHPQSVGRWRGNIHGHLHDRRVLNGDGTIDERYINVCVEHTNWRPILFEKVIGVAK